MKEQIKEYKEKTNWQTVITCFGVCATIFIGGIVFIQTSMSNMETRLTSKMDRIEDKNIEKISDINKDLIDHNNLHIDIHGIHLETLSTK